MNPNDITTESLAEAIRRLASGDQTPPRAWAYLSRFGISNVDESCSNSSFCFNAGGKLFEVSVEEL